MEEKRREEGQQRPRRDHEHRDRDRDHGRRRERTQAATEESDSEEEAALMAFPNDNPQGVEEKCFKSGESEPEIEFFRDSGSTSHLCCERSWFYKLEKLPVPTRITMADGNYAYAYEKGKVNVLALVAGKWTRRTLKNVLYVEGGFNLFSEQRLTEKRGFSMKVAGERAVFYDKRGRRSVESRFDPVRKMHLMRFKLPEREMMMSAIHASPNLIIHQRCCHVNMEYIRKAVKMEAVEGLKLSDKKDQFFCNSCHLGKCQQLPFKSSEKEPVPPAHTITFDSSGHITPKSLGGNSYFLLMKDVGSNYQCVRFMKHKSESAEHIINFIKFIEKQTGNEVKRAKSDCAPELISGELEKYFKKRGILHCKSPARNPQCNGKAEAAIKYCKYLARTTCIQAKLDRPFWSEMINASCYIQNRMISKNSPKKLRMRLFLEKSLNFLIYALLAATPSSMIQTILHMREKEEEES